MYKSWNRVQREKNKIFFSFSEMSSLEDEFIACSRPILQRGQGGCSDRVLRFRYLSTFGIEPKVTVALWNAILESRLFTHDILKVHLLWTLMFLKVYSNIGILSNMADCDVKTYRDWTWTVILVIDSLYDTKVSLNSHLNVCFSLSH